VTGESLFRQATWHATLLHPFLYVIDFKRSLNFGEAQAYHAACRENDTAFATVIARLVLLFPASSSSTTEICDKACGME
jgi:hypothetical protein